MILILPQHQIPNVRWDEFVKDGVIVLAFLLSCESDEEKISIQDGCIDFLLGRYGKGWAFSSTIEHNKDIAIPTDFGLISGAASAKKVTNSSAILTDTVTPMRQTAIESSVMSSVEDGIPPSTVFPSGPTGTELTGFPPEACTEDLPTKNEG
jgi:hypothetical protein